MKFVTENFVLWTNGFLISVNFLYDSIGNDASPEPGLRIPKPYLTFKSDF